jgi:hypothetical protein
VLCLQYFPLNNVITHLWIYLNMIYESFVII